LRAVLYVVLQESLALPWLHFQPHTWWSTV